MKPLAGDESLAAGVPATTPDTNPGRLLATLVRQEPLVAVELRPPRSDLDAARSMNVWIDMYHAIQRLSRQGTIVMLTDDATGASEEESLGHLAANLGDRANFETVVPFLTCKHDLYYCRLFARRAASLGVAGLTVVGGDRTAGPRRCVPHAKDLRRVLRAHQPGLPLGGWANPHRDACEQARFLAADDFSADFVLTQVVSHHSLDQVERFQAALAEHGVDVPIVYGVFFYRSANPRTLERLGRYFPVPAREVTREFDAGVIAEEICGRTIRALRAVGADKVYVSNLASRDATVSLQRVLAAAE